jgi:hypothetical protein
VVLSTPRVPKIFRWGKVRKTYFYCSSPRRTHKYSNYITVKGFLEELHCFVLSNVVLSISCNISQTSSLLFTTLPSKLSNSAFSYIFWVSSSSKTSLLHSLYVCFETSVEIVLLQLPT